MSIEFLITSLIVVASPGTGVLYTLGTAFRAARAPASSRRSAARSASCRIWPPRSWGWRRCCTPARWPSRPSNIWASPICCTWPGTRCSEHGALKVEKEVGARSALQVTVTAILVNILNPKLSIFFLAFLPQFVSTGEAHPLSRMLELSGVFMLMTFVVFVGYGLFAAAIRDHVISRPRVLTWMRRSFAAAFVALGAKLASADR